MIFSGVENAANVSAKRDQSFAKTEQVVSEIKTRMPGMDNLSVSRIAFGISLLGERDPRKGAERFQSLMTASNAEDVDIQITKATGMAVLTNGKPDQVEQASGTINDLALDWMNKNALDRMNENIPPKEAYRLALNLALNDLLLQNRREVLLSAGLDTMPRELAARKIVAPLIGAQEVKLEAGQPKTAIMLPPALTREQAEGVLLKIAVNAVGDDADFRALADKVLAGDAGASKAIGRMASLASVEMDRTPQQIVNTSAAAIAIEIMSGLDLKPVATADLAKSQVAYQITRRDAAMTDDYVGRTDTLPNRAMGKSIGKQKVSFSHPDGGASVLIFNFDRMPLDAEKGENIERSGESENRFILVGYDLGANREMLRQNVLGRVRAMMAEDLRPTIDVRLNNVEPKSVGQWRVDFTINEAAPQVPGQNILVTGFFDNFSDGNPVRSWSPAFRSGLLSGQLGQKLREDSRDIPQIDQQGAQRLLDGILEAQIGNQYPAAENRPSVPIDREAYVKQAQEIKSKNVPQAVWLEALGAAISGESPDAVMFEQRMTSEQRTVAKAGIDKVLNAPHAPRVKLELAKAMAAELDNAMLPDTKGGIDFNADQLNMQIKRDGNGVPLPLPMQNIESINIEGFVPQILSIQPVTSLPILSEAPASDTSPSA
jgi:hypothetical protein